jgi:hypothetical protein
VLRVAAQPHSARQHEKIMQIRAHAEKRLETGMFGSGKETKADTPSKLRHRRQCKHFIVTYAAQRPLF